MALTNIALYRPKPGQAEALWAAVKDHLDVLRAEGLATETAPVILRAQDGTLLEIFDWVSKEAIDAAHSNPRVADLWARFGEACTYVTLKDLPNAGAMFPAFERVRL